MVIMMPNMTTRSSTNGFLAGTAASTIGFITPALGAIWERSLIVKCFNSDPFGHRLLRLHDNRCGGSDDHDSQKDVTEINDS